MVSALEMTSPSQSPRDRILWIIANKPRRKAGAEQIEEMHRDEICPLRSYPCGAGQRRQNQDIRRDGDVNISNPDFNF